MSLSSRERFRRFLQDYRLRRLDHTTEGGEAEPAPHTGAPARSRSREYLREYLRWLRPHRYALGVVFLIALVTAGLQLVEPLFMRFIIDRVLLNTTLDSA
jgi:ATP-binding cassette subfamily B protein/subfamily B ATP-binding cassette protein MsbA